MLNMLLRFLENRGTLWSRGFFPSAFIVMLASLSSFGAVHQMAASDSIKFKPIDDLLSGENRLKFGDFELRKTVESYGAANDLRKIVLVMEYRGQEVKPARFETSRAAVEELNAGFKTGLVRLLGEGNEPQIVIMNFSGGAHCCWSYWVYATFPAPRKIFETVKWGLGYQLEYADIDHDGSSEISQSIMTFDYFERCCHAASALPRIIFKFDESCGEYVPANARFPAGLLKDTNRLIADLKNLEIEKEDSGGFFLGAVLQIVLPYVYAGREKEGWGIFDRIYTLPDREEMKAKVFAALEGDAVYGYVSKGLIPAGIDR